MIYADYARIYDRSGQIRFSVLMEIYLQDLLHLHPIPGRSMIDLACGTGTLALMMAKRGWQVLGIDRSLTMLHQARLKAANAGATQVQFAEADMREFAVATPVDLVTCCYDSVNYLLTEADLARCFKAVAGALRPGGLFCFDLATDLFLRNYWRGIEVDEGEGWMQIMQSSYDASTGYSTLKLTGFIEVEPGLFERFREVHVERAYSEQLVRQCLNAAGFEVEAVYDCFTTQPPSERTLREMYVARRVDMDLANADGQ
jgi:SAM-dependent methyltransferase